MKILVCGGGSIGRRHIGNFLSLPDVQVSACDINPERTALIDKQFKGAAKTFQSLDQALAQKPDAVVIGTPPHLHVSIGKKCAEAGAHLLIEKPIAHSLDGLADLLSFCDSRQLTVMTAYMWRFSPSLRRARELVQSGNYGKVLSVRTDYASYLPDWHPWEDYRHFYMAKKAQGGGAILDESHAIDMTRWLGGEVESVMAINGRISKLEIETDDIAEMIVRLEGGAVGSIHLDLYSRAPRGRIEIALENGNITWDRFTNEARAFDASRNVWEVHPFSSLYAEMYIEEIKYFMQCITQKERPQIDGWEGMRSLEVAAAAIASSEQGQTVKLPAPQRARETVGAR